MLRDPLIEVVSMSGVIAAIIAEQEIGVEIHSLSLPFPYGLRQAQAERELYGNLLTAYTAANISYNIPAR